MVDTYRVDYSGIGIIYSSLYREGIVGVYWVKISFL